MVCTDILTIITPSHLINVFAKCWSLTSNIEAFSTADERSPDIETLDHSGVRHLL